MDHWKRCLRFVDAVCCFVVLIVGAVLFAFAVCAAISMVWQFLNEALAFHLPISGVIAFCALWCWFRRAALGARPAPRMAADCQRR